MTRILKEQRNCLGIYEVRECGLLIDARTYYRAFYHCARKARRYILMAGWQFDSDVALLRGDDVWEADGETRLRPFLNQLCERNAELQIYMLAWDYSILYMLNREWFQDIMFNWRTNERLHFRFDDRHAVGASHHQKLVVIDGVLAFVGGLDICASRWDDRDHLGSNPYRIDSNNEPYHPYHDIQSYHFGPVASALAELFKERWTHSGGGELLLPPPLEDGDFEVEPCVRIEAKRVAVSRTRAKTLVPLQESIQEIRNLFVDAIGAAERLIYMENQYFSSQAVYQALIERMKASGSSPLQIILFLPRKLKALVEEISMGTAQARMLRGIRQVASETGHSFGIYYSAAMENGELIPTYMHSKLLLVDDRFLTVGSANMNNRSMGLDTELNVAWEAEEGDAALMASIRRARVSLLAEHAGMSRDDELERLAEIDGLVDYLNQVADSGTYRLHHHTIQTLFGDSKLLGEVGLGEIPLDTETPILEENVFELISHDKTGLFAKGITLLNEWLEHKSREGKARETKPQPSSTEVPGFILPNLSVWFRDVRWFRLLVYVLLVLGVLWIVLFD
ncbi:MAG: hypothetical protein Kow0099_06540 [Candidatus Abyssubacteria bacterium]